MDQVQVIIPLDRYNELCQIEKNMYQEKDIDIIANEDVSDALQLLFVSQTSISHVKNMTGVEIKMIDHPSVDDPLAKIHRFKKLLVITKTKKSNEEDRSKDNS